jgi:hypothetical protein
MELDHLNPEVHHDNLEFQQTMLDQSTVFLTTHLSCATNMHAKQQHREQYIMDRQLACGQFSKCGRNIHYSETYISLNSGTPLALQFTFVSKRGKGVIVNQIIFNFVISFF